MLRTPPTLWKLSTRSISTIRTPINASFLLWTFCFFVKQIRRNYNNYLQPCTTTPSAADISVLSLIIVVSQSDINFLVKQIRQNYNNNLQPCTTTPSAANISVVVVVVIIIICYYYSLTWSCFDLIPRFLQVMTWKND